MNPKKWLFSTLLVINFFCFSTSIDSLTSTNSIKDGDVLVSSRKIFALGFFSPGNSTRRYVGIWYNQISEQTIVWVANRNNPVYGKSGVLSINGQGDIVLSERNRTDVVWTMRDPRVFKKNYTNSVAQLLDTGNLVLFQNDAKKMLLWQSFDYPTHTLLPFMKLGLDRPTGLNWFLTSWKSADDPGLGNYSYRIDPSGFPQLLLYKGSTKWWRTGSWTGQRWSGVPQMTNKYIFNVTYINNPKEVSIMYSITNPTVLSRMVLSETGLQQRYTWNNQNHMWIGFWSAPKEQCDYYDHCGVNSNCNPYHEDVYECTCLPGFEPRNPQEWYLRDGSDGCMRKHKMSICQRGEGFVKVTNVKVPDTSIAHVNMSLDLKACENTCLRNCSCMAYTSAYYEKNGGVGCMTYYGDMLDTRTYTNFGQDLYIRVDARELAKYAKNGSLGKKGTTGIVVASIAIVLLAISIFWLLIRYKKAAEKARKRKLPFSFIEDSTSLGDSFGRKDQDELPLFDLNTIAAATNNFSDDHKLGEGGFGPVYKGVLYNGKQIAVKRLSKCSGQGIEEFRNEVTLIAKLQHRNLVRILGCCIEAGEKMLVYEFLPNKSLDTFIFRETNKSLLDWRKRFDIICGIARGILYLHQDSRLRIIHRDLKASNVLLDDDMNPKIADFGMARIFGGNQVEANTNRVVGTYGYMSPEYAMEGLFSIKSDVYGFGVLLVEIITGKKNSGFFLEDNPYANLIGHVWDLWNEGRATEMADESLGESYSADEVSRCIQIGLLCVQEHATDRPTMTTVVNMLSVDSVLPSPKQPAFIERRKGGGDNSNNGASEAACSVNEVTMTMIQGR